MIFLDPGIFNDAAGVVVLHIVGFLCLHVVPVSAPTVQSNGFKTNV